MALHGNQNKTINNKEYIYISDIYIKYMDISKINDEYPLL